mgnify:FL=1
MTQKFYHNPINDELEYMPGFDENSPKTATEKLIEKGFREKPLTDAELGIYPKNKGDGSRGVGSMFKRKINTTGGNYIEKEQRLYENLKVPGYETAEKSDASYKQLKSDQVVADRAAEKIRTKKLMGPEQREKDPDVTGEDWRLDTPRYRKHLADIIADEQTNIRLNPTTGKWQDKWGDEKTAADAANEQNKIEQTYNEIFPPSEQKKYEQSQLTPIQKKRIASQEKKLNNFNKPKIKKTPIGYVKTIKPNDKKIDMWDDVIYKNMSPIERGQFNASVRKNMPATAKFAGNVAPSEIKKEEDASTYSSTHMLDQLNEIAEIKLRDQILSKEFENIMRDKKDPDQDGGIASVPEGVELRKRADTYNKLHKQIPKLHRAGGVGTIIGEFD